MINGGGQEKGLRSGTLSPALCVGLGEACAIAEQEMVNDQKHVKRLFNKIWTEMQKLPEVYMNGSLENRYYGNLNISFAFIEGESLIMGIKKVCCELWLSLHQ